MQQILGSDYLVALSLMPKTPPWLTAMGAMPMKLGLDLRGGIALLMQVDVDSVVKQRVESDLSSISQALRTERVRYASITRQAENGVLIQFRSGDSLSEAYSLLAQRFSDFTWTKGDLSIQGVLSPAALTQARQDTMDQAMNTLRNSSLPKTMKPRPHVETVCF